MNPLIKEFVIFFAVWPLVICACVFLSMKLGKGVARIASQRSGGVALKKAPQRAAS